MSIATRFHIATMRKGHVPFMYKSMVCLAILYLSVRLECFAYQEEADNEVVKDDMSSKPKQEDPDYDQFLIIYGRGVEVNNSNFNYDIRKGLYNQSVSASHEFNNKPGRAFFKGVNQFSDLSLDEKLFYLTGMKISNSVRHRLGRLNRLVAAESRIVCSGDSYFNNYNDRSSKPKQYTTGSAPVPDVFSWLGAAPRLLMQAKNQGRCGVSWAFAAVGLLEAQLELKQPKLSTQLSVQQLIDCSKDRTCLSGGTAFEALEMVDKMRGIMSEQAVRYQANTTIEGRFTCRFKKQAALARKIHHGLCVTPSNDIKSIERFMVRHGPIAVPMHATEAFFDYKNGTFVDSTCDPSKINHELILVGLGMERDSKKANSLTKYWLLKNSWGSSWGENGFVKILPGSCGTSSHFTSALIEK